VCGANEQRRQVGAAFMEIKHMMKRGRASAALPPGVFQAKSGMSFHAGIVPSRPDPVNVRQVRLPPDAMSCKIAGRANLSLVLKPDI